MGSCTAGGARVAALADEAGIVRGTGAGPLGGAPVAGAATGEEVTAEELGGAEGQCRHSGVTDYMAEDDAHALALVREIVATLPPRRAPDVEVTEPEEPRYDPREIYGILPRDLRRQFDVREVIARL